MTLRPTRSRSRSSASSVCPASRNCVTASCSSRSALPVSWWKPYSRPRACSTVSSASESLPRAATVSSSRSGRERSVTYRSCGRTRRPARRRGSGGGGGDRCVDEPLGELAAVRGGAVRAQQPTGEVHAVDDQVHLGGEVLGVPRHQLGGEGEQPHVQLVLVVGGGAAGRVLRVVVLAADVGERAPAEADPGDVLLHGVHDGQQGGAGVVVQPVEVGVDVAEHGGGLTGEIGADEVVLALEEPVHRHLAQAGLPDQLVHADTARAAGREQSLSGVQDDLLTLCAGATGRCGTVLGRVQGKSRSSHEADRATVRDGAVRGTPGFPGPCGTRPLRRENPGTAGVGGAVVTPRGGAGGGGGAGQARRIRRGFASNRMTGACGACPSLSSVRCALSWSTWRSRSSSCMA